MEIKSVLLYQYAYHKTSLNTSHCYNTNSRYVVGARALLYRATQLLVHQEILKRVDVDSDSRRKHPLL